MTAYQARIVARPQSHITISIGTGRNRCTDGHTNHRMAYPTAFGPEHWIYGRCERCGVELRLSNTTHRRFTELGGACTWLECKRHRA